MNKKLIAAAVSAAVVAPVASHADAVLYGRINNAIDINDVSDAEDADSTTNLSGVVSRIGVRANADVGNGLSVHGHYEFGTTTDREKANENEHENDEGSGGIEDTRIATVGISGGFGRIDVGNQWSAYFNTFGTIVSPTYTLGYYMYTAVGGGAFRASNTIKYSNTFGPVTAQLDVRLNEDGAEGAGKAETLRGEGIGLGLSFAVTDNITIAAAFDSEEREDENDDPAVPTIVFEPDTTADDGILGTFETTDDDEVGHDEDRLGIAVKANFGGYWAALGWQNVEYDGVEDIVATGTIDDDDDGGTTTAVDPGVTSESLDEVGTVFLWGGGNFSEQTSWMVGYSQADDGREVFDADTGDTVELDDSSQVTVGIYHNVGGGLRLYYEGVSLESENRTWDGAHHLFGMRVDF